jgi:hypothetical protein
LECTSSTGTVRKICHGLTIRKKRDESVKNETYTSHQKPAKELTTDSSIHLHNGVSIFSLTKFCGKKEARQLMLISFAS